MPIGNGEWGCNTLQFRQVRRVDVDGNAMPAREQRTNFYRVIAISLPRPELS
jgi:hypothetical protein